MRLESLDVLNTIKEGGQRVYSPHNKPSATDVGAHPTSWKPTWNDVSSKPSQATRWPSWAEVTGKPSGIINQSALDGRYLLKGAKAVDSDKLDGRDSAGFSKIDTVSGSVNSGNWYRFAEGVARCSAEFIITEGASGKHGFVRFQAGISYGNQPFINIIASAGYADGNGLLRFIRVVNLDADNTYGKKGVEVYVDGSGSISVQMGQDVGLHAGWSIVSPKITSSVKSERAKVDLNLTTGFISTGHMYAGGGKVYSTTHKPTAADVGAYAVASADSKFALKTQSYSKAEADGKYQPKNAKLTDIVGSQISASGQDFKIRGKRALVGTATTGEGLILNYGNDFGKVNIPSDLEVGGEIRTLRVEAGYNHNQNNSIGCSNWFRSSGNTGWYNGNYGGGIHMTDSTWVRIFGKKQFHVDNTNIASIYTLGGTRSDKGFFWGTQSLDERYLRSANKSNIVGASSNWDEIGWNKNTSIRLQGHNQFWLGAGNGTWFTGTANKKGGNVGGVSGDVSSAHDVLLTTMQSVSSTDRGFTFGVATDTTATKGYRLGKWHSGSSSANSLLTIDGTFFAKGGRTDEYDYYADDYSKYWSSGTPSWGGDGSWHKPAIVASSAIQIQSGNTTTNARKPQLQFHQYGYGGPVVEYDGPGKIFSIKETGGTRRLNNDGFRFKTFKVYHEGHKPTAAEIGALGKTAKAASAANADKLGNLPSGAYLRDNGWNKSPGQDADNQPNMSSDFSYSNKAPHTGPLVNLGVDRYNLQVNASYGNSSDFSYRTRNGDNGKWNPWARVYSSLHKPTKADVGLGNVPNYGITSSVSDSSNSKFATAGAVRAAYNMATSKMTQATADGRYLGKTAKAADSNKLDGLDSANFMQDSHVRENSGFDANKKFGKTKLFRPGAGAVNLPGGTYGTFLNLNNIDTDQQIYMEHGGSGHMFYRTSWSSGAGRSAWAKVYSTRNKPTAADVGALGKTAKAIDSDKLDGINSSSFLRSDADDTFSRDLISTARDRGLFGVYDSTRTDQIWSMGTAYRNHSSGINFGNLYGLAYKHTNNKTGGTMAGGHQMVWCTNGSPRAAMGESGIWTSGTMYEHGKSLTSVYESKLSTDRKRKITYGTANPTGGASGDIYIQYK